MEKQENNPYYVTSQSEGFEGERGSEEERKNGIFLSINRNLIELPSQVTIYKFGGDDSGMVVCPSWELFYSVMNKLTDPVASYTR